MEPSNMLTSSNANQYLRPEYLSPLPTTLDAKKSPLALLAQTCSQIGADSPNTKLVTSNDKNKTKSVETREKTSPLSISNNSVSDLSSKSSFKPYDLNTRDKSRSPEDRSNSINSRVRTPMSTKSATPRCSSNQSACSPRESPIVKTPPNEPTKSESSPSSTSSSPVASSKNGYTPSVYTSAADTGVQLGASFKSSYLSYPTGLPIPMDLMTSSLMAQHHHALKTGALNPYLEYARLKQSVAPPVCRDPYCTGCSLNSHFVPTTSSGKTGAGSCPAGCTQCDHAKTGYLGHAAAYAHAQLAALAAASQLPYVCNWIAGDANYCGKRFGTSDELLQHLRTHTSLSNLSESMLNAPHGNPLLHRTYPTPPLSPLATTGRFHPYSKPGLLPPSALASPSLAGFSLPPHTGLPPYFNPYSLYGPRLGTSHP